MSTPKRSKPDDSDDDYGEVNGDEFLSAVTAVEDEVHLHSKRVKRTPEGDPRLMDLLHNKFGLKAFRLAQERVINRSGHLQSSKCCC